MIKKLTYPVLFALLMVMAASCQKEEIKPFTNEKGSGAGCLNGDQRDGEDDPTAGGTTGSNGTVPQDSGSNGGTTTEEEGDGGITDGGGSSEQDQKGKRNKKP